MDEWTVDTILGLLGKLPRSPDFPEAGLKAYAEEVYFAGRRTKYETADQAAGALGKARAAFKALGPRGRHAVTRAIRELRPDPWHHPVGGCMPLAPSPWDQGINALSASTF